MERNHKELARLLVESLLDPPKEVRDRMTEVTKRVRNGLNGPGPDVGSDRMTI